LEKEETSFASYRLDKESLIDKLQQELKESELNHSAAKAHLESSKQALDVARRDLEEERKSIESKVDSLGIDSRSSLVDVKALLSNLNITLSSTESLVKTANDLQTEANNHTSTWIESTKVLDSVIEGNDKLQESVTSLSSQSDEMHKSFTSVQQDVALTNQLLAKLERLSSRIKDSLADLQMGINASTTNDVIIARLENRSMHMEELLTCVQQGLQIAMLENSNSADTNSTRANETEASISMLESRTDQINESLLRLHELLSRRLAENTNNSEMDKTMISEALSRLEGRTDGITETLSTIQQLLCTGKSDASEELKRLGGTLASIQKLLSNVLVEKSTTQSTATTPALAQNDCSQQDQVSETNSIVGSTFSKSEPMRQDSEIGTPKFANDLIDSCVSEAVSAVSPKVPVQC
jgi:chromosome segregation ATPase